MIITYSVLKTIGGGIMKVLKWSMVLAIPALIVAAFFFLPGCMTSPDKEDYSNDECFVAVDCLYRLKDSEDNSSCMLLVEACRDSMKEGRSYKRLEYCSQNKFDDMKENECRLLLMK